MQDTLELARRGPLIPVIVIHDAAHALPMAEALLQGGIQVMEVTLRTVAALPAIEAIARAFPEALVGAGTVRDAEEAASAQRAGSRFAVSPGFDAALARQCAGLGLPLLPGVASASEVMAARAAGFRFLKFFPAVPAGGVPMLKALQGPFPDICFCPTGGLTPANVGDFLALANVAVCGGSWLTPAAAMAAGDFAAITALARSASQLRHG